MSWAHSDLRILLLGRTGSGKSSTANTILGRRKFRENVVTPISKRNKADVGQRTIIAIDTPGLFNPAVSEQDLMTEISNGVSMSDPGPHAILLVIRLDVDLTEDEKNIVTWIENNFGNDAVNFTFILFTHADLLNSKSAEDRISESPGHKLLIDECEGRYHLLNNMNRQNRDQVTELLKKMEQMVQKNMGQYCNIEVKNTSDKMLLGMLGTTLLGIGICAFMALKRLANE